MRADSGLNNVQRIRLLRKLEREQDVWEQKKEKAESHLNIANGKINLYTQMIQAVNENIENAEIEDEPRDVGVDS